MMKYNIIKLVTLALLSAKGINKRQLIYRRLQFIKTIQEKIPLNQENHWLIVGKLFINSS